MMLYHYESNPSYNLIYDHQWIPFMIAKTKLITFSIVIAFPFTMVGCAVSTDYDKSIGQENALVVEQQMGLYDDSDLRDYIKSVGTRLVKQLERPEFDFTFEIIDDAAPNAFALPGGYIYISRGLLSIINTESELACVLGHEIIHVTERHSIAQMKKSILPNLVQTPGRIIGNVVNQDLGNVINAPFSVTSSLYLANYSRSHETQSDELGIALAAKAGYDPMAMGTILTRMNDVIEYKTNTKAEKSYFDSHPFTIDRVEYVAEVSQPIKYTAKPAIQTDYLASIDGLPVGENINNGIFQNNVFIQPQLAFSLDFPIHWQTINKPQLVGAVDNNQSNVMAVTLITDNISAKEVSEQFSQYLNDNYSYQNEINSSKLPWSQTIYNVQIVDNSRNDTQYLDHYWVDIGEVTLQIMTLSTHQTQQKVQQSVNSIRPLSKQKRATLSQPQIDIVILQNGESLTSLVQRTNSTIDVKGVKVLNGFNDNTRFKQGQEVKIVVDRPLSPL